MNNHINNNILQFNQQGNNTPDPETLRLGLAKRVRSRRLEMNLTQKGMAVRAGIPLATYRRFEACGESSFSNLILIAVVLGMTADIEKLFSERRFQNIEEVINAEKIRLRKRGRRND